MKDSTPSRPGSPRAEVKAAKRILLLVLLMYVAVAFVAGVAVGFFLGLASTKTGLEFLARAASTEQAANVAAPARIDRPAFSLLYPGNWRVNTDDDDYQPDHLFALESPGSSFTMFAFFEQPADVAENLEDQVDEYKPLLSGRERMDFEQWGGHWGKGAGLKGRIMGFPAQVRIFCASADGFSFTVVEQSFEEDLAKVKPGLLLIEQSFKLKAARGPEPAKQPGPLEPRAGSGPGPQPPVPAKVKKR